MKNFEDFLKEKHAKQYTGTDDDMEKNFDRFMSNLEVQDVIDYADEYAAEIKMKHEEELRKLK